MPQLEKFEKYTTKGCSFTLTGLNSFSRLLMLGRIAGGSFEGDSGFGAKLGSSRSKKILFITSSEQKCLKYQRDLDTMFGLGSKIFEYQDVSPYEGVLNNLYKYAHQVEILTNLENAQIILAPVKSLLEKFPTRKFFEDNSIKIKKDEDIDIAKISKKLVEMGFKRTTMVTDIGEFSIRGDIIDVFTLAKKPVRIELWGDNVVDIRLFDNITQRSFEKLESVEILPIHKFANDEFLDDRNIQPLDCELNPDLKGLVDYLSNDWTIIFDEYSEVMTKFEQIELNYEKQREKYKQELEVELSAQNAQRIRKTRPLGIKNHIDTNTFLASISSKIKIYFNNFIDEVDDFLVELNSSIIPSFSSKMEDIITYIEQKSAQRYTVIICTNYKARIIEVMKEFELDASRFIFMENISLGGAAVEDFKLVVLTDKELFNKKSKDITSKKRTAYKETQEYIDSINDIQEQEYVVHSVHGVGRYLGLSKQEIDGEIKDYLDIEYAQGDKLYMPAEQINLLWRYRGLGSAAPHLSRMGGKDWDNIRAKVKKSVEDVAKELLTLYARRQLAAGIEFEPDTIWQLEMEEAFEYTETPDQMNAIIQTKTDMEDVKPMDRLICGDVGFGKTEVAIRAIFKAVMSGKQAVIIAPTTILALQHFKTIEDRFKPFPIKVELLSRFRSTKQQKETLAKLALGECDVVIGTHRLLQSDVNFKDLGLLVIDEEHRFGVKHKEKLKMLRKNIDILSMSATPIPRTLYMSLSGIKNMSVINTAPVNRLPIKTFVGESKESIIKNAVIHELDRDGQVFILYNRVETIYQFANSIRELVPNARIAVAHGQLEEKNLEQIMVDFANNEYDILVCTTIIESGLDIPNANTMIITNSDKLGLAQLYQIRGRVGRSQRQAYCYCLYNNPKMLTQEAFARLNAIKDFTTLGSGYQIALRDIEIRGVGNILGTKQHGQMVNVGFDVYCQLLEEAIDELQNEHPEEKIPPAIVDINITAFIPDEWVGSKESKMIEYKRLADVKSIAQLENIEIEWKDRFAKCPIEVQNLIKLVRLRLMATSARVHSVRENQGIIRIYLPYQKPEWLLIANKLSANITKYIKFIIAPKTCKEANSILLFDNSSLNFEETFNILNDLFYDITKLVQEYKNKL